MITKFASQLLRNHKLTFNTFEYYPVIYKGFNKGCRWKSNKEIVTSKRTALDTNVKPIGEKVKESTKTVSYLGVIVLGAAVTGSLFYAIFSELFSSTSPNTVYTKAVKLCTNNTKIQDSLGQPIVAYGEETRRRRRQHPSYVTYEKEGKKHLRMKFYLKGAFNKATVHLELVQNDRGKYEYRYLFVEVDDILRSTIVLEDNRMDQNTTPSSFFI